MSPFLFTWGTLQLNVTLRPCMAHEFALSVKLMCPSHIDDIFNNADVDPESNLFPLNLGLNLPPTLFLPLSLSESPWLASHLF